MRQILIPLLLGCAAIGCGDGRRRVVSSTAAAVDSGPAVAAPVDSASVAPPASAAPPPLPAGTLTSTLRLEIARAFAPQLRFNAYHDDGDRSAQNRSEDHFPMSVVSFLRQLETRRARVVVQGSRGPEPSINEERSFAGTPRLLIERIGGFPRDMAGDPPGTAPLYVHVYEHPDTRRLMADGSGELVVQAEYWLFYGYDRSEAKLFGLLAGRGKLDVSGHRCDWEHVSFRTRVRLGPGGVFAGGDVEAGAYSAHFDRAIVEGAEIERVDDEGRPDPKGRHAVVYVAQGKHANYPQAGHWENSLVPDWIASHTDFFRGNGVVVPGWASPLVDLTDPIGFEDELAPPEWTRLLQASRVSPLVFPDWTLYTGQWGPDLSTAKVPGLGALSLGLSPSGPKLKESWGDLGKRGKPWRVVKRTEERLTVYAERGITIPQAVPAPVPIRR